MKSITIIGFIGRDAQTIKDDQFIYFSVGVTEKWKDKKTTDWFNCYATANYYKGLLPYLKSGQQVCVMGSLYFEEFQGKTQPKINITDIELIGQKKEQKTDSITPQQQFEFSEEEPKQDFLKRKRV